jgi:peptide/nickel transport system substrate-binding protein
LRLCAIKVPWGFFMSKRHDLLACAIVLATSLTLGAARAETPKDTLVMAKNIDDIITLDPAETFELSGGEVINNLYTRLVTQDPADFTRLIGGVAESWTVAPDGTTITFKIRPGQAFASGRPVTARDAAYSLQRVVILNKTPAFILTQFGWTKDNVKELVRAVDESTLELKLTQQLAPTLVLNALSAGVASVVDATEVEAKAKDGDLGYGWLKSASAGSGAFSLIEWKPKDAIAMRANPKYYLGAPALQRVVIRHIPEPATQRLLLEKGDIDIARDLLPDQVAALAATGNFTVQTDPKQTVVYLALSQKVANLANPKVRQAIRWLVDYQGLANTVLKGQYAVHQGFLGKGTFAALEDTPFKFDPAKAKALLAEAGLPDGFAVSFDAPNSSPYIDVAQSLQATFKQGGIRLNIVQGDQKQVITKYRARNHEVTLLYWSPDYLDPHSTADYFTRNPDNSDGAKSKTVAWRNSWDIPELTKRTDAAALERDTEKRRDAYLAIQREVQADSPLVLMFQKIEQAVSRKGVTNYISGPSFDTQIYAGVKKN